MVDPIRLSGVVAAAAAGAVVNAIAGGGTLLTFPALVALGIPPLTANATSTVALWPGVVSSLFGYRRRLEGAGRWMLAFALPSLAGGAIGACLLLLTPADRFSAIVPWLVLGATGLFAIQERVTRRARQQMAGSSGGGHGPTPHLTSGTFVAQLLVAIYGGYFGAGVSILMLAVLGFMGFTDIHRMNGLKNWGGACMNFVAAVLFAFSGLVDWVVALSMALGALLGGYLGSRAAQLVPQIVVRRAIVVIGAASGVWLLWQRLH